MSQKEYIFSSKTTYFFDWVVIFMELWRRHVPLKYEWVWIKDPPMAPHGADDRTLVVPWNFQWVSQRRGHVYRPCIGSQIWVQYCFWVIRIKPRFHKTLKKNSYDVKLHDLDGPVDIRISWNNLFWKPLHQ